MDCRRRSVVDDEQNRIAFYQAQVNESLDRIDNNLRSIDKNLWSIRRMWMSSATIPASSPSLLSAASRDRKQFCNQPAVVDDYIPLQLSLRWRDPPPDRTVCNHPTVVFHDLPPLKHAISRSDLLARPMSRVAACSESASNSSRHLELVEQAFDPQSRFEHNLAVPTEKDGHGDCDLETHEATAATIVDSASTQLIGPRQRSPTRALICDLSPNRGAKHPQTHPDTPLWLFRSPHSSWYLPFQAHSCEGRVQLLLTRILELYIGYFNNYKDWIPLEIENLRKLIQLDKACCGRTSEISSEIGKLENLDMILLQMNGLAREHPPELDQLQSLKSMALPKNAFTVEIPPSFVGLNNLALLNQFSNKLYGNIPDFISDLQGMEVIQLWKNTLTGSIPQHLDTKGWLLFLDLSSNRFTGGPDDTKKLRNEGFVSPFQPRYPDILTNFAHPKRA